MTVPSFVGSPITITATGSSGSQSVTVPAGANFVLALGGWWDNGNDFSAMSLNGDNLTKITSVINSGYDHTTAWYLASPTSGTFAWSKAAASTEGMVLHLVFLQDVASADQIRDWDVVGQAANNVVITTPSFDTSTNDLCICVGVSYSDAGFDGQASDAAPSGSGQTQLVEATNNDASAAVGYKTGGSGTTTMQVEGSYPSMIAISIKGTTVAATLEQEGLAFGDDDGSESGHTLGTQDSNATAEVGTVKTLRLLIDATSDPASTAYALRYQKNGSGGYTAVPVGSGGKTQPVIEAADCTQSGDNATTPTSPWSVSRPTAVAGDLLILIIGWDDSTNNTGITVANGPNGEVWSQINSVVASASTEVRMTAYYVVATGSWGAGSISVTPAANEQWTATVIHIPAGEFDAATPIGASATRASAGTAETSALSPAMTAGSTDGSGTLIFAVTTDTDPLTTLQSGYTSIANTDRGNEALGVAVRDTAVTNSESIAGGDTWALASDSWCSIAFVVRAPTVTNEIYIAPSSNVTPGGEATTARLTAPSGKTTGDFATGRRWDDENGSDSVDIGADEYTELEWVLNTQSPAAVDDYYEFRVYAGAAALDTYTVTPRLTLISGSSPITVTPGTAVTTLAAVSPTAVQGDISLTPGNAPLALAGVNPTAVAGDVTTAPGAAAISLSGVNPTAVLGDITSAPVAATLALSGVNPAVVLASLSLAPGAAALSLTAVDPNLSIGAETVTPGAAALALAAVSPVTVLASLTLTPGAAAVALTAVSPAVIAASLTVAPGAGSLVLAAVSPTAQQASLTLIPGAVTLSLAAVSPAVALGGLALAPGAAALALTGVSPSVGEGALLVTPGASAVQLLAIDPTAVYGSTIAQPGAATAYLVAISPAVSSGALLVNGGVGAVALSGTSPAAILGNVTAVPGVAALALAAVSPTTVQGGVVYAVTAAVLQLTAVSPTVPSFESVTVTPGAALVRLAAADPTVAVLAVLLLRLRPRTFDLALAGRNFDLGLRPRSFDLRLEDW